MALTKISRSLLDTGISDSSDATAITINSSEQVGIGVSPSATLQVKAASGNTGLYLQDAAGSPNISWLDAGGTVQWQVYSTMGGANGLDPLVIYSSAGEVARIDTAGQFVIGGTTAYGRLNLHGTGSTTASLTGIKESSFTSYDDNGSSAGSISGFFNFKATTGIGGGMGIIRESASDWGSAVAFYNHPSTTSNIGDLTERLRINSSGNVGIGTSTITSSIGWTPKLVLDATSAAVVLKGINNQENAVGVSNGFYLDSLGSTTGSYNTFLFRNTSTNSNFSATERMRIDADGRLLLNKTSSQSTPARFDVTRSSGEHAINTFVNSTGNSTVVAFWNPNGIVGTINTSGSATSYNTSSDARLKNVTGEAKGLEIINNLKPVEFEWKSSGEKADGLIAQEVEEVFPQAVSAPELDREWYSVDYSKLVTPLIKGMQEQQKQIEELKKEIEALKN